jgi:mannosyl-oligosaccharide glucosidase
MGLTMYIDRLNAAQDGTAPEMDIGGAASGQQVFGALAGIEGHASELLRDADAARDFLKRIYSRLRTHYLWFRRTQAGEIDQWDRAARSNEAYRWRGRSKTHVLTSGMDDYPRAPVPHSGELHLDLLSWIGSFADAMRRIAEATGEEAHAAEYAEHQKGVVQNLEGACERSVMPFIADVCARSALERRRADVLRRIGRRVR